MFTYSILSVIIVIFVYLPTIGFCVPVYMCKYTCTCMDWDILI